MFFFSTLTNALLNMTISVVPLQFRTPRSKQVLEY